MSVDLAPTPSFEPDLSGDNWMEALDPTLAAFGERALGRIGLMPEVNTLPGEIVDAAPTIEEMVAQLDAGENANIDLTAFDVAFMRQHNIVAESMGDIAAAAYFASRNSEILKALGLDDTEGDTPTVVVDLGQWRDRRNSSTDLEEAA